MSVDFRQVQNQVKQLGEQARLREQRLSVEREKARGLLKSYARDIERMRQKVGAVVRSHDASLRCALPLREPLDAHFERPADITTGTLLAADGSQISPDRHAEVNYCLINVGAIQMAVGLPHSPEITVESQLLYDEQLYTDTGTLTDASLALARDLSERSILARLASHAPPPAITFTDGPMELWGSKDGESASEFQQKLEAYQKALTDLCSLGAITAGYVDKPAANLVIRLLEVMLLPEEDLPEVKKKHPLRGVSDMDLFRDLLGPGERSAVFAIQSKSAFNYQDELSIHFFYLNVGRPGRPWIARVEAPQWVTENKGKLDNLHAALAGQCEIMGSRSYPYLLHRAHEAAVVSFQEKEQVTSMIVMELRRRGLAVGSVSQKQGAKNLSGKKRY